MYDGRTLHSTMPNHSNQFRSALLINALQKDIMEDVKLLDNNGIKLKLDKNRVLLLNRNYNKFDS